MSGWSLAIGRVFGVSVRMHSFFLFLLVGCMMWASYLDRPVARGVALWMLMLLAVAVRETARALAAGWYGLDLRGLVLMPYGGVATYGSAEANRRAMRPAVALGMALAGPVANLCCGLTLAGLILAVAPAVDLGSLLWVTPIHLVRAAVWVNLLLAAVHLLPAWPLDAGRVLRATLEQGARPGAALQTPAARQAMQRLGPGLAALLAVYGVFTGSSWFLLMGLALLLGARLERQGIALDAGADSVRAGDVMLTEFSTLSASATLEDALERARHSLQDVFPVVRGTSMVGAVARGSVLEAYAAGGNGYVQGIMAKLFYAARPDEPLVAVLAHVQGEGGASSQLIPVVEGERIVGIITPQHLTRSVGLLARRILVDRAEAER